MVSLNPRRVRLLPKAKQLEGSRRAYLEQQPPPDLLEGYSVEHHPQHNQALEEAFLEEQLLRIKHSQQEVFLEELRIIQLPQPKEEDFLEEELNNKSQQEDFLEANSKLQHQLKEEDYLVKMRLQPRVVEAFLDRMQLQLRVEDYLGELNNKSQQEVVFLDSLNNCKIKEALILQEFLSSLTKTWEDTLINSSNSHKHSNNSRVQSLKIITISKVLGPLK